MMLISHPNSLFRIWREGKPSASGATCSFVDYDLVHFDQQNLFNARALPALREDT